MRFLIITAFILSTLNGQELRTLRAPDWGWLAGAPNVTPEAGSEKLTGDGRVRQVQSVDPSMLKYHSSDEMERVLVFTLSNEAAAQRLHFEDFRLPAGGELYVYGLTDDNQVTGIAGPYRGAGPANTGEFWTKALAGSRIAVELQLADEIAELPFTLREVALADGVDEGTESNASATMTERRVSLYRGMVIEHEVINGEAIWQGDILLGREDELEPYTGDKAQMARMAVAINSSTYRWPGGVVPYTIDPTMPSQSRVTDAIAHWNTLLAGHIQIKPRTTESSYVNFVRPTSSGSCSSYIGRIGIAGQQINLGDSCSTGNAIHEIGHALGLYHEHTRSDRASFIRVNTANIDPNYSYNFDLVSNGLLASSYDYGSIMHYGNYAFSSNGLPTIETIPAGIYIGQRSALSAGDVAGVKVMYPASTTTTTPPPTTPTTTTYTMTFNTSPSGLTLTVDGVNLVTPATVNWTSGTSHTISAPNVTGTTSYTFQSWSDGGAQTHTVTPTAATTYTATYKKRVKLTLRSSDATKGTVVVSPSSTDGYYDAGQTVTFNAAPLTGSCFAGWGGIVQVNSLSTQLTMNQPYDVTANFQTGSITISPIVMVSAASQQSQGSVSATGGCIWKGLSSASWLSLQSNSGAGSGLVRFNVNQNTSGYSRTGIVYVNGRAMWVAQSSR